MSELTIVTDSRVLEQYPHLSPAKERVVDMEVSRLGGKDVTVLRYGTDPGDAEAGHGRLLRCEACGTYLRSGQPHSAVSPFPHQALDMLVVVEPADFEELAEEDDRYRMDALRRARGIR